MLLFPSIKRVNDSRSLHNWPETSHSSPSSLQNNICMLRNLSTHFNPCSTTVAMWQQSLENLKNNFLNMFLEFHKLLSTLHLIVVECLFTV